MRTQLIALTVALLSGAALSVQVGVNAELRRRLGDATLAAVFSFAIGLAALLVAAVIRRPILPAREALTSWPWWIWLGGLLGAAYITAAAALAVRLGGAGWLAAVIAGQILTALMLDHFGWLGFRRQPLDAVRCLGVVFLLLGVALILRR